MIEPPIDERYELAAVKESLTTDERATAEETYTRRAFDYEQNPVGSRDWTLFWSGWCARATQPSKAQPPCGADGAVLADRDYLGRAVREAWVRWALTQPNPKQSWLAPYDDLSEPDKEADRQIGEHIAALLASQPAVPVSPATVAVPRVVLHEQCRCIHCMVLD